MNEKYYNRKYWKMKQFEYIKKEDNFSKKYSLEDLDFAKTKILKYIAFKKRTENEIRLKFNKVIDEELLDDAIEKLKENGYIDDSNYIKRAINEFMALKNLSIKEIKYKLMAKGLSKNLIDDYISNNLDTLIDYEIQSAKNIAIKKSSLEKENIKNYLLKKGYRTESIDEAMEECQWIGCQWGVSIDTLTRERNQNAKRIYTRNKQIQN